MTATTVQQPEYNAKTPTVARQPDGIGKRVGKKGEITIIAKVLPNGAKAFRERLPQIQTEAWFWETKVGTVDSFRAFLIDNDTRLVATVVYDGDFVPYIDDIFSKAGEWLDRIFLGVIEGFEGSNAPSTLELVKNNAYEAELFYVAHPETTVRDVARMERLSNAVTELLDAAS